MAAIDTGDICLLGIVTTLACYQLATFARRVGGVRRKFKIDPPEVNGPTEFLRTFRAQQNCLEFAPIFFGTLWMAGLFFHQFPAAVLGLVYIYGREQYFNGYVEDVKNRRPGFKLCARCLMGLLGLIIAGISHAVLYRYLGINLKAFVPFI